MKILTLADKLLFVFLVGATLASFLTLDLLTERGSIFTVEVNGELVYRGRLSEEKTFTVQGTKGELSLHVQDGAVRVVEADCPNRICVRMGKRMRSGDMIVCVPNRTIIRITGSASDEVRAVTG